MSDESVKREIEQLRREKDDALRRWREEEGQYGSNHPRTGQAQAYAQEIQQRLRELERSVGW